MSKLARNLLFKQKLFNLRNFSIDTDLLPYEMPEKYRNAFYLANASLFDSTNWFIHKAYEVVFPTLFAHLRRIEPTFSDFQIANKIKNVITKLEPVNVTVDVNFPVKKELNWEMVRGFRVQHGLYHTQLPSLGGIRIGPEIDRNQIKALAVMATYQNACYNIPMSGSHGGIRLLRSEFAQDELKQIIQKYILELIKRNFCGEFVDVIHPDKNVDCTEMSWIFDLDKKELDNCIAGKSGIFGSTQNYTIAACKGICYAVDTVLNHQSLMDKVELQTGWKDKTFIIEGLGKIGSQVAILMEKCGAKCIGVKEWNCTLYDPSGISAQKILDYKAKHKSILNFSPRIKPYASNKILQEKCDLLILAATHKTMSCYIAENVLAKVIVEAAKAPITPSAHKVLTLRGKIVVPDIIANCGTAVISSVEYFKCFKRIQKEAVVSNNIVYNTESNYTIPHFEVVATSSFDEHRWFIYLESLIKNTITETLQIADWYTLGSDIKTAAYIKAIEYIFKPIFDLKKY